MDQQVSSFRLDKLLLDFCGNKNIELPFADDADSGCFQIMVTRYLVVFL